ncbi:PASTA domain-containing protein [Streptomyces olivoreticuli]|uniref:PASTA domain-containing protein n=1 Tax=Streptomyces olivoreticuli TaxID=68246 RepID=UPI00265ADC0F|nr:PASTA domain-containing protein [Streptomyces olivoreticuli]WKK23929.1 PASTA domain-containing protein [Streptomyces olivoreticuli]
MVLAISGFLLTAVPTSASATSVDSMAKTQADPPMPDLKSKSLTAAYNTLGAGMKVEAKDVSGQGRHILWPNNWKVCDQSPAPGRPVGKTVKIGAVKKAEECPRMATTTT